MVAVAREGGGEITAEAGMWVMSRSIVGLVSSSTKSIQQINIF